MGIRQYMMTLRLPGGCWVCIRSAVWDLEETSQGTLSVWECCAGSACQPHVHSGYVLCERHAIAATDEGAPEST